MKIKFTLQRPAGAVDLLATVDGAATVGDLARYLVEADPVAGRSPKPGGALTLGLPGQANMMLDPRQLIVESSLRSGVTVTLSRSGDEFLDQQRAAAAVVKIVGGPDSGAEFSIPRGSSMLGRDRGSEVRVTDPLVSRRHARINVTDTIEIIDLGSANGVLIDDVSVPRSIVRSSDVVQVGDTSLSVRLLGVGSDDVGSATVRFVRSPRLDPDYEGIVLEAPELPERPRSQRFPIVPLFAPLLMGALLFLITKSATSLVFVALSPLMLVGNAVESRLSGRSAYKRAVADFREDVSALVAEADELARTETTSRQAEHPSTGDVTRAADLASNLLWARRPEHTRFGHVRLGLGRLPSRNAIELPSSRRASRALFKELADAIAPFTTVDDVPVVADLAHAALGIAGARPHVLSAARAMITQLVGLHSPAELVLCVLASSQSAVSWEWTKWLPHTMSPHSPIGARHLAATAAGVLSLTSELEELIQRRAASDESGPAVAVLVEDDAPIEHSRLVGLAENGPTHGVYVLWVANEITALPAACKTYLDVGRDGHLGAAGFVHAGRSVTPVALEGGSEDVVRALAQRLAPVVDVGARIDDESDLPRAVSLLALAGSELGSSAESVIERWSENRSIVTGPCAPPSPPRHSGTLRAVIGQSATEIHALDLRMDGPHALVGGTTGAGKSELLQTWILAMATAHSPQRLNFLLVDYKGGSAFRDCVELPHTVGLVTDLSTHLVRRALTSLSAELRYREHLLASHAAKDLVTLERFGVADAPPSLVIVVDEFAALVNEVPEFVDGVVNVAQRGRSLGLHLILATQRPTGVIKDNLRANTNLRVALRMADEADSSDVLGSAEAAFFDPSVPGRAVSKTGPGRLVPFQTGYAGGWTNDQPAQPDLVVEELVFGAGALWELPEVEDVAPVDPGTSDIRRIVTCVGEANRIAEIEAPRKPWLPELKPLYDVADQNVVRSRRTDRELVFGLRDDPDSQSQPTVAFYPDRDGNLAVYGTGGSGKSTLLRTIAVAAGFTIRGGPCHVYGLDFGARGLAMLAELPHVGSIVDGSDHERITRLVGWLRSVIDERALRYSRVNAGTITEYRQEANEPAEPRILLLVDGIAAFRQAYETADRQRWFDMFVSLASDGRRVGIHIVLSSDQRAGMTTALASAVQRRVVLRLAAADDYSMLSVQSDILSATSPSGRGILDESEIQVALLGTDPEVGAQARAMHKFADAMRRSGVLEAPAIEKLAENVWFHELPTELGGLAVLGTGGDTLRPLAFQPRGGFIISGPPQSGRTTTMLSVATALRRHRPSTRFVLFTNRSTALSRDPIWNAVATGAREVAEAARALSVELPSLTMPDGESIAIFVENMSDLTGALTDAPLADLLKLCTAEGLPFVAEGETASWNGGMGLVGQLKAGRSGIALQPDSADGPAIYRTNLPPRLNRADFPQGRGFIISGGTARLVQVARDDRIGGDTG